MKTIEKNYYSGELAKINTNSEFAPTIKITGSNGNQTKQLSINKESAEVLIKWLQNNFVK